MEPLTGADHDAAVEHHIATEYAHDSLSDMYVELDYHADGHDVSPALHVMLRAAQRAVDEARRQADKDLDAVEEKLGW